MVWSSVVGLFDSCATADNAGFVAGSDYDFDLPITWTKLTDGYVKTLARRWGGVVNGGGSFGDSFIWAGEDKFAFARDSLVDVSTDNEGAGINRSVGDGPGESI